MGRDTYVSAPRRGWRRDSSSSPRKSRRRRSSSPFGRSPVRSRNIDSGRRRVGGNYRRSRSSSRGRSTRSLPYRSAGGVRRRHYSSSSVSSSSSVRRSRPRRKSAPSMRSSRSSSVGNRAPRRHYGRSRSRSLSSSVSPPRHQRDDSRKRNRSPPTYKGGKNAPAAATNDEPSKDVTVARLTGISRNINKDHLHEIFSHYGTIKEIILPLDSALKVPKGYAYVTYEKPEDAKEAMEHMNRGQIDGLTISINLCERDRLPQYAFEPINVKENGIMDEKAEKEEASEKKRTSSQDSRSCSSYSSGPRANARRRGSLRSSDNSSSRSASNSSR